MTSKTVVIATGDRYVAERFTAALQGADHLVIVIRRRDDLVTRLRGGCDSIDLLLLDLHVGPDGGADIVRSIRDIDEGRLPILVFSGSVTDAVEIRALADLGVVGYVNEHSAETSIVPALTPHLFPDNFNRRGSPRVPLAIPVSYRSGGTVAAALTLSLGKGGLAVRTMTPLELFAGVSVRFRLPGSKRDIEAESRVTWTDRRVGMGLQFERMDAVGQAAIDEFVDHHSAAERTPTT